MKQNIFSRLIQCFKRKRQFSLPKERYFDNRQPHQLPYGLLYIAGH